MTEIDPIVQLKTQYFSSAFNAGGAENARVDNVGVDKAARRNRGGQRGSGEA